MASTSTYSSIPVGPMTAGPYRRPSRIKHVSIEMDSHSPLPAYIPQRRFRLSFTPVVEALTSITASHRRFLLRVVAGAVAVFLLLGLLHVGRNSEAVAEYVNGVWETGWLGGVEETLVLSTRIEKLESLYGMGKYEGRSWLAHINALNGDNLAPLTHFTQQYLHDWQNPPLEECSSKTFYILELGPNGHHDWHGLGSAVHIFGWALRSAIDSNAILAWGEDPLGKIFFDDACRHDGVQSMDCVFEPITHCPRSSFVKTITAGIFSPPENLTGWAREVPAVFKQKLKEELPFAMTANAEMYWWRAQAAAYSLRLNQASLEYLSAMRLNETAHYSLNFGDAGEVITTPMPWPLPAGTTNMHIRHGNKGSEMHLIPFRDYVAAGERLAALNPLSYWKGGFISSEDAGVFEEARALSTLSGSETTSNMKWTWYGSHINRINAGPNEQLGSFGNRTETTLSWMSEFMISMECDSFIGTRGSNWNRLIDEHVYYHFLSLDPL
ncbi:hypothetical protein MNV49_006041 [Pseudohyphozyma bogoriensis]|nr:hypothetical protein MNV49_006041 [Pseudohyphozyma bogoriensis]